MNAARSARSLLESGNVSAPDGLAVVDDVTVLRGALAGERMLRVTMHAGLSFDVLVSRGLDIGALRCGGQAVAWRSPVRAVAGVSADSWLARWVGGMVTTCGLENIGEARDGLPFHGSHHSTPGQDVTWRTTSVGEDLKLTIEATVPAVSTFGHRLELHRTITTFTGGARLSLRDRVVNVGASTAPVSLLYHVNFGAPFLTEGTVIETEGRDAVDEAGLDARDRARVFTGDAGDDARLVEHLFSPSADPVVRVRPPGGRAATVRWSRDTLPRLFQWWWPAPGGFVLSIEPSTSPLFSEQRRSAEFDGQAVPPGGQIVFHLDVNLEDS